jgi:hypothetical protein
MSASNELRVNGTGFIGAKKALVKEVAYKAIRALTAHVNTRGDEAG